MWSVCEGLVGWFGSVCEGLVGWFGSVCEGLVGWSGSDKRDLLHVLESIPNVTFSIFNPPRYAVALQTHSRPQ